MGERENARERERERARCQRQATNRHHPPGVALALLGSSGRAAAMASWVVRAQLAMAAIVAALPTTTLVPSSSRRCACGPLREDDDARTTRAGRDGWLWEVKAPTPLNAATTTPTGRTAEMIFMVGCFGCSVRAGIYQNTAEGLATFQRRRHAQLLT